MLRTRATSPPDYRFGISPCFDDYILVSSDRARCQNYSLVSDLRCNLLKVGFMFDSALPKAKRLFSFGGITISVRLVDDDPGAVQVSCFKSGIIM